MKKIILALSLVTAFVASGCLKDKDFEDQDYGIQDNGLKGLSFVKGNIAASVTTAAVPQVVSATIGVNSSERPSSDILYTVSSTPGILPANLTPVPASAFTFKATDTIKAGSYNKAFNVTLTNPSTLDANLTYGVAFTLNSANQGYDIAANGKTVIIAISVQNQYHGDYVSNGYLYHPTAGRGIVDLHKFAFTISANSFTLDLGDLGGAGYRALITVNANNSLNIVSAPGAAGGPYTMFTAGLPTSSPGYTTLSPGYAGPSNYYDPATKTFYLRYGYMGSGGWRVSEEKVVRQ